MGVVAHRPQIAAAALHHQRLVAPAEDMTAEFVAMVQADGIGAQAPAHSRHQIGARRFHHQMKMVAHQAEGMHLKTRLAAGFGQGLEEILAVHVIQEDRLPAVPPAQDMVNRPGILDAHLARHGAILPSPPRFVKQNRQRQGLPRSANGQDTNARNGGRADDALNRFHRIIGKLGKSMV